MNDVESLDERKVNLGKPCNHFPNPLRWKGQGTLGNIHYIPKLANKVCMAEQYPLVYGLVDSRASDARGASAILS